jgi:lipopolysaccharide transport system ATP-binding protein
VLAVGDAEFQKKAIGKMQDVSRGEGRTVLFVSHNMGAVRNLCNRGVIMEKGCIIFDGKIDTTISNYVTGQSDKSIHYPKDNQVKSIEITVKNREIKLLLKYNGDRVIKEPNLGFVIYDNFDNPLFGTNPLKVGVKDFGIPKSIGEVELRISSPLLTNGSYPVSIWFSDGVQFSDSDTIFHGNKCLSLEVDGMDDLYLEKEISFEGLIIPVCNWRFN